MQRVSMYPSPRCTHVRVKRVTRVSASLHTIRAIIRARVRTHTQQGQATPFLR